MKERIWEYIQYTTTHKASGSGNRAMSSSQPERYCYSNCLIVKKKKYFLKTGSQNRSWTRLKLHVLQCTCEKTDSSVASSKEKAGYTFSSFFFFWRERVNKRARCHHVLSLRALGVLNPWAVLRQPSEILGRKLRFLKWHMDGLHGLTVVSGCSIAYNDMFKFTWKLLSHYDTESKMIYNPEVGLDILSQNRVGLSFFHSFL